MNYKVCRKVLKLILILLIIILLSIIISQRHLIVSLLCTTTVFGGKNEGLLDIQTSVLASTTTILLSIITIVIQALYQNEIREERRLSFQPFFCSKSEELMHNRFVELNQNREDIELYLSDSYLPYSALDGTHNILENIEWSKEFAFIKYCIKNIGRDSALNIEMHIYDQEPHKILSLQKNEEKIVLLAIRPDDYKNKCSISFSYYALDDKKYFQEETISFDDSFKENDTNPGWDIVFKGLSPPKQINKLL